MGEIADQFRPFYKPISPNLQTKLGEIGFLKKCD